MIDDTLMDVQELNKSETCINQKIKHRHNIILAIHHLYVPRSFSYFEEPQLLFKDSNLDLRYILFSQK